MLGRNELKKTPSRTDVAAAEPIYEIARKWMLTGGAYGCFAFLARLKEQRSKAPFAAVRPANEALAGCFQVARPARIATRMAEVAFTVGYEHANHPTPHAAAVAARYLELDDVAKSETAPDGSDHWIRDRENPILQPKRGAPK